MVVKSDQQLKYNDCGISAVKSVFNYYNIDIDRNYISDHVPLDEKGAWLHDIKLFFEQHGFNTAFNFLDLNLLKLDLKKSEELLPCILPVKIPNGLHYVVVYSIKGKKFLVLDPAEAGTTEWSVSEFIKYAHTSTVYYDWISNKEILQQLLLEELNLYGIKLNGFASEDETVIANKLTYFSYIKENFGFASKESERDFLNDLLHNLEISVPAQFRSLKLEQEKLRIKTPVVLTVKKTEITDTANFT